LAGSKSAHPALQDSALNVLDFTVRQGLYHPLEVCTCCKIWTTADSQCMPILISLETSELDNVSDRALALHTHLHHKHASLVNIRYLDFARASYEYQRSITSEVSGHRHGEALLQGWYSLIVEKRVWRIDLLRSFIRAFDYDVSKMNTVGSTFVFRNELMIRSMLGWSSTSQTISLLSSTSYKTSRCLWSITSEM
jgi:cohesin loading factor subunit SCC2